MIKNGEKALNEKNLSKQVKNNNHTEHANKGKIKGHLNLEHIFGFCKTFKKITKNLGFHLTFKMNDLQDFIFRTIANDINVTINQSLYLYFSILIPNSETKLLFNESLMNNYRITFDSWYTERKISNNGGELQVDIASAQHINSPNYLLGAFQTTDRIGVPNKANNPNHVCKYFVEIDSYCYPRDGVSTNFEESSYSDQFRGLKVF